jgi:hypothetical protein
VRKSGKVVFRPVDEARPSAVVIRSTSAGLIGQNERQDQGQDGLSWQVFRRRSVTSVERSEYLQADARPATGRLYKGGSAIAIDIPHDGRAAHASGTLLSCLP